MKEEQRESSELGLTNSKKGIKSDKKLTKMKRTESESLAKRFQSINQSSLEFLEDGEHPAGSKAQSIAAKKMLKNRLFFAAAETSSPAGANAPSNNARGSRSQVNLPALRGASSTKELEKFKFFQGDQSIFSKDFSKDQSRFYQDSSSIVISREAFLDKKLYQQQQQQQHLAQNSNQNQMYLHNNPQQQLQSQFSKPNYRGKLPGSSKNNNKTNNGNNSSILNMQSQAKLRHFTQHQHSMTSSFIEDDFMELMTASNNPRVAILKSIHKQLDEVWVGLQAPERLTLLAQLEQLQTSAKEVKDNYEILLKIIELHGKILRDLGDYSRAVTTLKQARLYCNIGKLHTRKLYFYKIISDTYVQMREYDMALSFAKKILRLAWRINDPDYEIIAYDKIGMIFYYKGELQLADFFHDRAYSNIREPKNSSIRKTGEQVSKKKQSGYLLQSGYETESGDDFELGLFQNSTFSCIPLAHLQSSVGASANPISGSVSVSGSGKSHSIPIPRKLNEHIRSSQQLGRTDVPYEKKLAFMDGEAEGKYIYNHMSLNRNLKNFMVQQYVNHSYWAGVQDQLSNIKHYHLHRNYKNIFMIISKIRRIVSQHAKKILLENVLLDTMNGTTIFEDSTRAADEEYNDHEEGETIDGGSAAVVVTGQEGSRNRSTSKKREEDQARVLDQVSPIASQRILTQQQLNESKERISSVSPEQKNRFRGKGAKTTSHVEKVKKFKSNNRLNALTESTRHSSNLRITEKSLVLPSIPSTKAVTEKSQRKKPGNSFFFG